MRLNYSSRFWLYAPLALFLGLTAWAIAHWWLAATALDNRLKTLNGHQAVPGIRLSWKSQTLSGFPFRMDVVLDDFSVRAEAPRGPVIWHSEHFASHALTYGRAQDIFEAAGQQSLSWTDADSVHHQLNFLPGTLRASTIADNRGLLRFDLDMLSASGKDTDGAYFTAGRAQFHMRRDPKQDAIDLMLSATEVNGATPFGDHVKSLNLYATVTQGSAFARLLAGQTGWMDALMTWRHLGGVIEPGQADVQSSAMTAQTATPELKPRLRALLFPLF